MMMRAAGGGAWGRGRFGGTARKVRAMLPACSNEENITGLFACQLPILSLARRHQWGSNVTVQIPHARMARAILEP